MFSGAPDYMGTAAPNDRFDNLLISGTADNPVSPAPEPSQVGMMALMGLGLGSLILRARKKQTGLSEDPAMNCRANLEAGKVPAGLRISWQDASSVPQGLSFTGDQPGSSPEHWCKMLPAS